MRIVPVPELDPEQTSEAPQRDANAVQIKSKEEVEIVNINVLEVVAEQHRPGAKGLGSSVEKAVAQFLDENDGEKVSYTLEGTTFFGTGLFGRTLVVLQWESKNGKGSKKRK